ncbi:AT-hook motif nuclear-localized protein 15-like [Lotus japonicus]|uniref:AT-hook motif nuclear-localized protein 15-like n=1 Tax=Lotus japonicus TaxID=34305 RepID=UPI00258FFCA5|nr:AT-hook motif nuclear-localized protein 15-like [Lotus japonicus]
MVMGLRCLSDSSTQEAFQRPRGRPFGYKNKPKSLMVTKKESENHLKPITIEIPYGNDVIATIVNFANSRQTNILEASGVVSDILILHPQTHNGLVFPNRGVYEIISLNGTYIYSHFPSSSTIASDLPYRNNFMIYFSIVQGVSYGGFVAGKLIASSVVVVTVGVDEISKHSSTVINHHSNGSISMGVGNNNARVNFGMSAYVVVVGGCSNPLKSQLPPQPPTHGDVNVLKLNDSTHPNVTRRYRYGC